MSRKGSLDHVHHEAIHIVLVHHGSNDNCAPISPRANRRHDAEHQRVIGHALVAGAARTTRHLVYRRWFPGLLPSFAPYLRERLGGGWGGIAARPKGV